MKLFLFVFLLSSSSYAATLSNEMSTNFPTLFMGNGSGAMGTNTFELTNAFACGVSGRAYAIKFNAPASQTGEMTMYVNVSSETGTPSNVAAFLYPGASGATDDDRPECTFISSTSVSLDGAGANVFSTFTFTSALMTGSSTYYVVFANDTATPLTNHPIFGTRKLVVSAPVRFLAFTTTDGFATDPIAVSGTAEPPCVFKFADGSKMGMPYTTNTAHANNTNDRGVGFMFPTPWKFDGFCLQSVANSGTVDVYQGSTLIESFTPDKNQLSNSPACYYFTTTRTQPANTWWDYVANPTANSTSFSALSAGSNPPTDVALSMPQNISYVDGTTPGSYTRSVGSISAFFLIPNNVTGGSIITGGSTITGGAVIQ